MMICEVILIVTWLGVGCEYQVYARDTCSNAFFATPNVDSRICLKSMQGKYILPSWSEVPYKIQDLGFANLELTQYR